MTRVRTTIDVAARLIAPVLALVVMAPRHAAACSCLPLVPCESSFYTAVFQGEVIDISPTRPSADGYRTATLKVERTWRGQVPAEVTVMTEANEAACGYSFRAGVRYLVYAYKRGDRLWTGLCSVKPLDTAAEDLAFWKSRTDPVSGALAVYGTVTPPRGTPAGGYTVVLRNEKDEWKTMTDADGRYGFGKIPPGSYTLTVIVADSDRVYGNHTVNLPDPRACAFRDFRIER